MAVKSMNHVHRILPTTAPEIMALVITCGNKRGQQRGWWDGVGVGSRRGDVMGVKIVTENEIGVLDCLRRMRFNSCS